VNPWITGLLPLLTLESLFLTASEATDSNWFLVGGAIVVIYERKMRYEILKGLDVEHLQAETFADDEGRKRGR
jgi:hypothetical protein